MDVACLGKLVLRGEQSTAQHSAAQSEYSKGELAGVGFKRVSARVIFHASATTYAYKA